jgi:pilus assembly protein Flp/PilA
MWAGSQFSRFAIHRSILLSRTSKSGHQAKFVISVPLDVSETESPLVAQELQDCQRGVLAMLLISRFLRDESGATAIEYCLIAVGISIVIITAVNGIGGTLSTNFGTINSSLK